MGQGGKTNSRLSQESRGACKKDISEGNDLAFQRLQGWLQQKLERWVEKLALSGKRLWFWTCWVSDSKKTVSGPIRYQAGKSWMRICGPGWTGAEYCVLIIMYCRLYKGVVEIGVHIVWVSEGKSSRTNPLEHICLEGRGGSRGKGYTRGARKTKTQEEKPNSGACNFSLF